MIRGWAPVAHTCNPSYSGDRVQEDQGSKPAQPYLKKNFFKSQKSAGRVTPIIKAPS
jgi:hypothetical protein